MRPIETYAERAYREAIEEALRLLDAPGREMNLDSDSGEMTAWTVLFHALDEVERMPDPSRTP